LCLWEIIQQNHLSGNTAVTSLVITIPADCMIADFLDLIYLQVIVIYFKKIEGAELIILPLYV